MTSLRTLIHLAPSARHEQALDAERRLRATLPVVRRVGFAALRGGSGCSTAARGVVAALETRRERGVLLIDAVDDQLRGRTAAETSVDAHPLPLPVWPGGIDLWRSRFDDHHRAHEITVTDWGVVSRPALSAVAAHSHVLCLATTVERGAVQHALDTASSLIDAGNPTILVASAVRGRLTPATRRMLASPPVPIIVLPFDRRSSRDGATGYALSMLGAEIVARCAQPRSETRTA